MLKQFRTHHLRRILWALVIIIVPSFVFWGVSSFVKAKKEDAYVRIDGTVLTNTDAKKYKDAAFIYYRFTMGDDFYTKINQKLLESKALELILLDWKAKKDALEVSNAEVVDAIQHMFSIKGVFSNEVYTRIVKEQLRIPLRVFEEDIRTLLLTDKVLDKYVRNVEATDDEIIALYEKENEQIKLSYVVIASGDADKEKTREKAKVMLDAAKEKRITTLKDFAKHNKLEVATTEYVTAKDKIDGLSPAQEILSDAPTMKKGEIHDKLYEIADGIAIVQLEDIVPIDEKKYAEEKESYREQILNGKVFIERIRFLSNLEKETKIEVLSTPQQQ